jgi:hypothetical protein
MNDEKQEHLGGKISLHPAQVTKTLAKLPLQRQDLEEFLKDDQPPKGCQFLIFEPESGKAISPAADIQSGKLHRGDSPGLEWFLLHLYSSPLDRLFPLAFMTYALFPNLTKSAVWEHNFHLCRTLLLQGFGSHLGSFQCN